RMAEVSADAVEISKSAKEQEHRLGELLKDFSDRARAQVARIDGAVEQSVGNVQHAGESVKDAVLKPVREVNGVLAGIKTAIAVYSHGRRQSVDHATQDEEMFIEHAMANLALVYGLRLLPSDELESFEEAKVTLKN